MSALSGSAQQVEAKNELVWPTDNDVIMGQVWLHQLTGCNFQFVIARNARAFLDSQMTHPGVVITNVAEQLRLLAVRFLLFDYDREGYIHIMDERLIAAEISAAFVQYYAFSSATHFPSAEAVCALESIAVQAIYPTIRHASDITRTIASSKPQVVDLTKEEEDDDDDKVKEQEAQERCRITEGSNLVRQHSNQLQTECPSLSNNKRLPSPASSLSLPSNANLEADSEHGLQDTQIDGGIGSVKKHLGIRTTDYQQSSGEETGQRVIPVALPRAHTQVGTDSAELPEPLDLRDECASPLPGSYATTYAASFYPLDMTCLPHKTSDDMAGWQFFPMQMTQDLEDVPVLNEWKVVVVPMVGSSGKPFTISP